MYVIGCGDPDDRKKIWLDINESKGDFDEQKYKENLFDPQGTVQFNILKGSQYLDGTGSSGGSDVLHERVIDFVHSNALTGFDCSPVEIFNKAGELIPEPYYIARSTVICSSIDKSVSRKIVSPINPDFFDNVGFSIDMETVKSDFVRPDKTSMLLCNQKVKNIIEAIYPPVTGVRFTHISDFLI